MAETTSHRPEAYLKCRRSEQVGAKGIHLMEHFCKDRCGTVGMAAKELAAKYLNAFTPPSVTILGHKAR